MKSVGIIKEIDNLGRIVIPKEMRELFGLEKRLAERDPVEHAKSVYFQRF